MRSCVRAIALAHSSSEYQISACHTCTCSSSCWEQHSEHGRNSLLQEQKPSYRPLHQHKGEINLIRNCNGMGIPVTSNAWCNCFWN